IMCDVGLLTAVYHWHIMASGAILSPCRLVLVLSGLTDIMSPPIMMDSEVFACGSTNFFAIAPI
ncbi:hypothetical protein ABR853_12315, partial [Aeromonas caviae]|uniref:hypothetical protein n=1 Tax=Aeromonas caviae TaxID=648 RepID=UPI003306491A